MTDRQEGAPPMTRDEAAAGVAAAELEALEHYGRHMSLELLTWAGHLHPRVNESFRRDAEARIASLTRKLAFNDAAIFHRTGRRPASRTGEGAFDVAGLLFGEGGEAATRIPDLAALARAARSALGLIGNVDHSAGGGENAARVYGGMLNDIRELLSRALAIDTDTSEG